MKLILFILFCIPLMAIAKTPSEVELRKSIRQQLIQEEKQCSDCVKMHPEVLEREVDRIFASEKNKKLRDGDKTQNQ